MWQYEVRGGNAAEVRKGREGMLKRYAGRGGNVPSHRIAFDVIRSLAPKCR